MHLNLHISDYDYSLPVERIAQFPVAERDCSKLLIYRGRQAITHDRFLNIINYLSGDSLVVFNSTRVIHARILFTSNTGSTIEIFCLKPADPEDYETAFGKPGECVWECLVGNLRKWKDQVLLQSINDGINSLNLKAEKLAKSNYGYRIRFSWSDPSMPFGEVLEKAGMIPLPPYIKRPPVETDNFRYQTVYARNDGSVAAPTAGLHFTDGILTQLQRMNIPAAEIVLHVGAGTFLPVKAERIIDHPMHAEQFTVSLRILEVLMNHTGPVVAVGTTTVRTLESLYWLGTKFIQTGSVSRELDQWEPYHMPSLIGKRKALEALCDHLVQNKQNEFTARTRIMIIPQYRYRIINQLITNFHQPRSTLLLLVAALIGQDWKKVYNYALENNFRFLSYGDSSLLIP
jgi:S-adenosylmethionine:tRNA ribosyltransferase-isomerase